MEQQEDQTGGYTPRTCLPREGDPPTAQLPPRTYPLTGPISPILPRDLPGDGDVVGPILRDPNINQGLLAAAISQLPLTLVLSLFTRGQHC